MPDSVCHEIIKSALKFYMQRKYYTVKTIDAFDRQLWSAALALFRGDLDEFGFIDAFTSSIESQLTRAWNEGARDVGVDPRDFTDEDLRELDATISNEYEFIPGLALDIIDYRDQGKTLDQFRGMFRARIDLWVNRYTDTVNRARRWFDGQQKLEWIMGSTEEHCDTCIALDGIVAFAREWDQAMLHPQAPPNELLFCQGWHCDCRLEPTDKRRTTRAFDRLTEIALRHEGAK